jgi:hypothetical protein
MSEKYHYNSIALFKNDDTAIKIVQLVVRSTLFSLHSSRWSLAWRYIKENWTKFIHCRIWKDFCKSRKECEKVFIGVFTDSFILNGVLRFKTTRLKYNNWELNSKVDLLMLRCLPHRLRKISQSEEFQCFANYVPPNHADWIRISFWISNNPDPDSNATKESNLHLEKHF